MTGEFATDVSDASGTALFDVVHRKWSDEMVSVLGLDRAILPRAYESSEITGKVSSAAAEATGLRAGTPVVAGAGDQAASAIGNGIVEPGTVSCTLGTSGVVFAYLDQPAYDPEGRVHTFCHAIPGAWHIMGVTQGAGLSLQWYRNRFAPESSYDELTADASLSPPGAHGLFWLPYLMGERTPHLDANARAAWIGLTAKHQSSDLLRSILEGVCYSLKDGLEIIAGLGARPVATRLSGGGRTESASGISSSPTSSISQSPLSKLRRARPSALPCSLPSEPASIEAPREVCRAAVHEVNVKRPDSRGGCFLFAALPCLSLSLPGA